MPFYLFFLLSLRLLAYGIMTEAHKNASVTNDSYRPLTEYDQRMERYDVKFYKIDLEVTDTSTFLAGSTSILLQVLNSPVTDLVFDLLSDLTVDSVLLDGKSTSFVHSNNQLQVLTAIAIQAQGFVTVTVYYSGLGQQKQWISGIYNVNKDPWNKRITWTLSEPFAALNWFPCKQVLADKADSAWIFITTESGLKAGSNGLLTNTVTLPGNRIRHEWKTRYPIAYYLLSFAVGDYYDYSFYVQLPGRDDSLLIQNYIYDTLAYFQQNKSDIDKTADLISLYSELFGTYPFHTEKYGHCIVPSGGGMEHQTMTTLGNFSFLLVAHELSHQWFGDYVTCGSWQDIWINEGFASYAEYIACQYLQSQIQADIWMADAHEHIKTDTGGSVFVPETSASDEERIFDYRLSYRKGAAIIHMIRGEIQNDSLFFDVLREYLNLYKNSIATGGDFKQVLEEKTGMDFDTFFNQWYYGDGYPAITVNWKQERDSLYVNAFITSSSSETPMFVILTGYRISSDSGDTTIYRRNLTQYDEWKIKVPGTVNNIRVDPEKWLLLTIKGINNISKYEPGKIFYLAPNPAKGRISIYFAEMMKDTKIFVIDSTGKILFEGQSDSFPYDIDLEGYKPGPYIVLVEHDNRIYTEKFIRHSR